MAFQIDDDETRIQNLETKIDELEIQTFSPEVVARNESTRNTGLQSGDVASLNPYPQWIPIRDFGDVGLVTQDIVLNRVDSHIAKMKIIGDVDFAFSIPPQDNKMMWFILDVTIDSTGSYTINLPASVVPTTSIDNTPDARTFIRFTTTDNGTTYYAENLTAPGGTGGSQTPWIQPIDGAGFSLTDAGDISIKNIQTDGIPAILNLERNDTSPEDNDTIGNIFFRGVTDSLNSVVWAVINVQSQEVADLAKQGQLTISIQHDNLLAPIITYSGNNATFSFSSGVDVVRANSNGSKELGNASFFWDDVFSETFTLRGSFGNTTGTARTIYADDAGMIFNMPSSAPAFTHSIENEIFSLLTNGELEIRTLLNDGPTLLLRNNDQFPTSGSNGPQIFFNANDGSLVEFVYGLIKVNTTSVTPFGKEATMEFRCMSSNSLTPFMSFLGAIPKINMFTSLDVNANYIEFDDMVEPGAPGSFERRLFSDQNNSAHLTIRTPTGTIDLEAGGAGANTALSNLTDPTSVNQSLIPANSDVDLGTISDEWENAYIDNIHGVAQLNFTTHSITDIGGALEIELGLGSLKLENSGFTFAEFAPLFTTLTTARNNFLGTFFTLYHDSISPAIGDFIGIITFSANDSNDNITAYGEIKTVIKDETDGTEDGAMELSIANAGSLSKIIEIAASATNDRLGFFGVAPVVRQAVANGASVATVITALKSLGLFE